MGLRLVPRLPGVADRRATACTNAYTLLDLGFGFAIDRFRLNVDVRNVTDETYRDFLDTYKAYALSPGRSINVR